MSTSIKLYHTSLFQVYGICCRKDAFLSQYFVTRPRTTAAQRNPNDERYNIGDDMWYNNQDCLRFYFSKVFRDEYCLDILCG